MMSFHIILFLLSDQFNYNFYNFRFVSEFADLFLNNYFFFLKSKGFWGFGEIGRASCRERV